MIGIWKSEGWDSIIGEQADFVPYIPVVLQELELCDVRDAFEETENGVPKNPEADKGSGEADMSKDSAQTDNGEKW